MSNKFSDFMNNAIDINNFSSNNFDEENYNDSTVVNNEDKENIENIINKYSNFTSDELMQEFLKLTENKRNNGTLNGDLERMKNTLTPFLNREQLDRMNDIINKVK